MKIILAGGRRITYYLAKTLLSKGMNIVIINDDKAYCEELAGELKALVINGDASILDTLDKAEIFPNDTVVVLTPKDQDNLIISQLSQKVLGVSKVFTLVNDPENVEIFKKLGLNNVISMTEILSGIIEQRVSTHQISNIMSFEEGKVLVLQLEIREDSPSINIALKDLGLPRGAIVGTITREDKLIVPYGDTPLQENDRLLVMCLPSVQSETIRKLTGRE